MRYRDLIEDFLPHTEEDDVALSQRMLSIYDRPRGAPRKDRLHRLFRVGGIEVTATLWPPGFHTHFFFLADGEPIGFAILKEGGRSDRDEGYAITIIFLQPAYRKLGLASAFYRFLLSHGIQLIPDTKQSAGGAAIWSKLRRERVSEAIRAYHGTAARWFRAFKLDKIGTGLDANLGGVGLLGRGFYFTPSERKAADYGRVIPVMLDLQNPLTVGKGTEWDSIHDAVAAVAGREVSRAEFRDVLRQAGYDGIIRRDFIYPELDEYVAFDPSQIKIERSARTPR